MPRASFEDKAPFSESQRLAEVARIKSMLIVSKLTLTKIDQDYRLPPGTAGNAVHEPHLAGERAIAAALNTRPSLLWRSRYWANGRRKSPQPVENYRKGRKPLDEEQEAA